ncbi:MAG: hypothetical protein ACOZF2_11240 [Thermodesulfobacteriota bacterium]
MLEANSHNVPNLKERTRLRNSTVWIPLDWGGIMQPLSQEAGVLASLGQPYIEGYMVETDELFAVKEYQRDRLIDLEHDKITQEGRIADADAAAKRQALAIKLAAEEYIHSARLYDAQVRALIMAAKEYAAEVEREQIELEKVRAILGVKKAETRIKEINAEVYYEYVKRMEVQVDIARAQVDAAKAQTRAVMAEIGAQEAELDIVETELKEAMTVADKATLQADIASIYADIIVKSLAKIRLSVGMAEIEAGFRYIQQKLADLLAIWDVRTRTENLKTASEQNIYDEVMRILEVEEAAEDLKKLEMALNEEVQSYEKQQTDSELDEEQALLNRRLAARKNLENLKNMVEIDLNTQGAWAKMAANGAQQHVYKNHQSISHQGQQMKLYISKG